MKSSVKDIIRKRRSVRTFDERPISKEDMQKLSEAFNKSDNPFGIPMEFRFLDAKKHALTSPVIIGTDCYVAAKINRVPMYEVAFGYSFEKFCLYATDLGIGTVMLGGTFNRSNFEKAMDIKESEVMAVATPIGYPADKMSVREKLMRKGIKADERVPFETIFFDGSFAKGLTPDNAGNWREALEMLRLAPSAANKQPWRVVVCGDTVHFYEKRAKGLSNDAIGDMQKVDMGIGLAHFDLTLNENGITGEFVSNDPGFEVEESTEYIISYEMKN